MRDQGLSLFGGQDEEEGLCYMRYLGGWRGGADADASETSGVVGGRRKMEGISTDHERGGYGSEVVSSEE
jgi:hypothetical protein